MTHTIDGYGNAPRIAPPPPPPPPPPPEPEPVPEHVNEQSRKAVDETIGPDTTAEQRTQAYEEAQQHYDMISSGGDFTGVSDAEMQLAAISRMEENGIPTRFDPEVVAAAGEAVKPYTSTSKGVTLQGATAGQRMEALELVQEYVDGVGGVGDVGITAEALPGRADQILRDAMAYSAKRASAAAAATVASGVRRTAETGRRAAAVTASDPRALTSSELADIRRRVLDGEKIRF